jgi:small-conductance mechanosensitive channel
VYYVLVPDYDLHMDIQQAINLALLKKFRERGIVFAYPTRQLHIAPAHHPHPADTAAEALSQVVSRRPH